MNEMYMHPYRHNCPCVFCTIMRERSPGNAQMAYQRRLAAALVYPREGKAI